MKNMNGNINNNNNNLRLSLPKFMDNFPALWNE